MQISGRAVTVCFYSGLVPDGDKIKGFGERMRIINSDISAELQKEYLKFFAMVEFVFGSATYRYNETEETIYDTAGNPFLPRSFTFANIDTTSGMSASSIDIVIDDTDKTMSAILLGEDVRNKVVKLYLGAVTETSGVTEIVTEEFMRGIIGGWELSEDNKATITIQNEFILWSKKTLRIQSSSCPWVFKGIECTYAGQETWCDQSYPRCKDLGNSDYFGGFRFLPSITGTEIKWGGQ
jgi:hypothetical protein